MRSKEFITESYSIGENKFGRKPIPKVAGILRKEKPDLKTLAEITIRYIEKNCQPWLQSTKKDQIVYRSIVTPWEQTEDNVVFTRAVRKDRLPMDSSPRLHGLFNTMIEMAGGVANRSNSAFVSGSYEQAGTYDGPVHVVMPVGNFRYTWSPYYEDWFQSFAEGAGEEKHLDLAFSKQKFKQENPYVDAEYKEHKQEWGRHSDSKKEFIEEEFREWYKYKIETGDASAFDQNNIKKLIKADTGLPQAIKSGNELMISASKMLYIRHEDFYKKYIEPVYTFR